MSAQPHRYGRLTLLLLGAMLFAARYWFRQMDETGLWWLLRPLAWLVSSCTGAAALPSTDGIFHFPELNILLYKGCAGAGFFRLAWWVLAFLLIEHRHSRLSPWWLALMAGPLAWVLTLGANTARIISLLHLQRVPGLVSHSFFHGLVGWLVYAAVLGFLCLLFRFRHFHIPSVNLPHAPAR